MKTIVVANHHQILDWYAKEKLLPEGFERGDSKYRFKHEDGSEYTMRAVGSALMGEQFDHAIIITGDPFGNQTGLHSGTVDEWFMNLLKCRMSPGATHEEFTIAELSV